MHELLDENSSVADLTSKNADLLKSNEELRWQVIKLQDQVQRHKKNARFGLQHRFI